MHYAFFCAETKVSRMHYLVIPGLPKSQYTRSKPIRMPTKLSSKGLRIRTIGAEGLREEAEQEAESLQNSSLPLHLHLEFCLYRLVALDTKIPRSQNPIHVGRGG